MVITIRIDCGETGTKKKIVIDLGRIDAGDGAQISPKETVTSQIVGFFQENGNEWMTPLDVSRTLGLNRQTVKRTMYRLLVNGHMVSGGCGRYRLFGGNCIS